MKSADITLTPGLEKGARFYLGMGFLIFSLISPFFIPLVVKLPLTTGVKGVLSTLLVVGGPELAVMIAVVLLGKETFHYFIARIKSYFRLKKPVKPVGRIRYLVGLVMFWVTILVSLVELNYEPAREIYGDHFTEAAIAWNVFFIASLVVLGGNFWDKLRSLFIYDAYAIFPRRPFLDEARPTKTNNIAS